MGVTLALSPSDGMALTMAAILGLTLGTIFSIFWFGARNARRKPDIEKASSAKGRNPTATARPLKAKKSKKLPANPGNATAIGGSNVA